MNSKYQRKLAIFAQFIRVTQNCIENRRNVNDTAHHKTRAHFANTENYFICNFHRKTDFHHQNYQNPGIYRWNSLKSSGWILQNTLSIFTSPNVMWLTAKQLTSIQCEIFIVNSILGYTFEAINRLFLHKWWTFAFP